MLVNVPRGTRLTSSLILCTCRSAKESKNFPAPSVQVPQP